ncbi:MFS transporter [Streptomyces sp. CA-278952]|uniref:MFS transporter n=1 Tax=unclassified Streptomyces TaxID=2593676 RepID=UPI002241ABC9|nr:MULTISPECIES: MFS transporter [unclassified Streptomyces]UZI28995.1 MFS transporter [Streptomyces sp. VB1]WDG28946.1 MFS transporter [Streptomyces sp. CA-278952]
MPSAAAAPPAASRLSRFGFPEIRGSGNFLLASLIQGTGNGLLLAFQLVYFTATTAMSAVAVGTALTLSRLLTLPAPAVVGPLMDRYGARRVVIVGNALCAVAFFSFLFVENSWQVVATGVAVQFGTAMFWTANSALVSLAAHQGDRTRWFGLIRVIRNVGLGVGGAVAALATSTSGTAGLRVLVIGCALSYAVAGVLIATWHPREKGQGVAGAHGAEQTPKASYRLVLRDHVYLRLVAVNVVFVLAAMVLSFLLAIYVVDALSAPTWLVGVLLIVNSALVIGGQSVATRLIERHPLTKVIAVASALDALAFGIYALLDGMPQGAVIAGLFLGMIIFTAGEILASPGLGELSVALAPPHALGRYLAVFQLSWTLGMALAPWLFTTLLSAGPRTPWLVLCALSVIAIPAVRGLPRQLAPQGEPAGQDAVPSGAAG